MGALYEDVENFFGDIFAWYGRIVARHPLAFIVAPVVTCFLLGLGLLKLQYETNLETLYSPISSQASSDRAYLQTLFPDRSAELFHGHQSIAMLAYGEMIILAKNSSASNLTTAFSEESFSNRTITSNVLAPEILAEVRRLSDSVLSLEARQRNQGKSLKYEDVCAMRNGNCVIDGSDMVYEPSESSPSSSLSLSSCVKYFPEADYSGVLSGVSAEGDCLAARALKLRFNLNTNSSRAVRHSLAWQDALIEHLKLYRSDVINMSFVASDSLQIELRDHVGSDTKFLGVSILAMIVLATVTGSGSDCVSSHVTLAYAGVAAALLAILAAFGLLSLVGLRFVNLCSVMPFLVLGIGADDMFHLLAVWRKSNIRDSTEERLASTLRSAAVSITITSLTDLLAFCIGATSPFLSVRNFCAFSGAAILLCYVTQLTFFSGCIVLHSRRVRAARHCLTCLAAHPRDQLRRDGAPLAGVWVCGGQAPRWQHEEEGLCRRISACFSVLYPRALLHWAGKCTVIVIFIVYLGLSIWGVSNLQEGFTLETLVPPESYYREHARADREFFEGEGIMVMFVVDRPLSYHLSEVQNQIRDFLETVEGSAIVVNGSVVSWLARYLDYLASGGRRAPGVEGGTGFPGPGGEGRGKRPPSSVRELIASLRGSFLPEHPEFVNDVVFSADWSEIVASRFYVTCKRVNSSDDEGDLMLTARSLAANATVPMRAFSPYFVFFEHYVSIMKNTLLPVGVTMIGMLFVALVFIPHPIAVTCVTASMSSVVLGMMGWMHFWGLALSAIATIQIILGVGICVSFTVHTTHAFMTATGKNRNERVAAALAKVGVHILNGALASLLSTAVLALGTSFIFVSCFKTMLLVFVLGVLHSILFLPVMLSFVGPRRTSKPRMFMPSSPPSSTCGGGLGAVGVSPQNSTVGGNSIATASTVVADGETARGDRSPSLDGDSAAAAGLIGCSEGVVSEENKGRVDTLMADEKDGSSSPLLRKVSFRLDDVPKREGREDVGGPGRCHRGGRFLERQKGEDVETQTLSNGRLFDTIEEITEESDV